MSPAIFGAMFQSIKDKEARRALGEHYTSEANILKTIRPLFLDDLRAEFERIRGNRSALVEFHKKLRRINILDPACGCGNFLVVAYRELRLLEIDVLRADQEIRGQVGQRDIDLHGVIQVDVDQFHGIEIEEFPARIAEVAMWLIDHQMNLRASEEFGLYFARIPLRKSANIVLGNALRMDWRDVVTPERVSYIIGNPPFVGSKYQSAAQREDAAIALRGVESAGLLDYVCCWYVKAARFLAEPSPLPQDEGRPRGAHVGVAFVSTNSITMGEQVGVLWRALLPLGFQIRFAHRTFVWSNEARGKAAVHCVIIGFGLGDWPRKTIFHYPDPKGEPQAIPAANINPYIMDAENILVSGRLEPLCRVSPIWNGSVPADGGNLILEPGEMAALVEIEPRTQEWLRPYLGARGFINGEIRYCLWLKNCPPDTLRAMPHVLRRVEAVRRFRQASQKVATREKAKTSSLFTEDRQPRSGRYLAIPRTSSENRFYIPMGYIGHDVIAANDLQIVPEATLYEFAVISSSMHISWARVTSGRLKSDIRYSVKFTYNTFPWPGPGEVPEKVRAQVEAAAQGVLDARARFPTSSLADLYDPLTMPPELVEAHRALDRAVDAAYLATLPQGWPRPRFDTEMDRVAFLFRLYEHYMGGLDLAPAARPRKAIRPRRKRDDQSGAGP